MHRGMNWIVVLVTVLVFLGILFNGYFAYQCAASGDPRSKECFMMSVMNSKNQNVTIWEATR